MLLVFGLSVTVFRRFFLAGSRLAIIVLFITQGWNEVYDERGLLTVFHIEKTSYRKDQSPNKVNEHIFDGIVQANV